jgi:hypothetical protein
MFNVELPRYLPADMPNSRDGSSRPRKRQEKAATAGGPLTADYDATELGNKSNGVAHPPQRPNDVKGNRETTSGGDASAGWVEIVRGMAYTAVPAWINIGIMVTLIFGGCCANVSSSLGACSAYMYGC